MTPLPSLFISHGAPSIVTEPIAAHDFLTTLADRLPKPHAILSVSAHWETTNPTLSRDPNPETVYDFYGFPKHLYDITYPAPGAPAVADNAAQLLRDADIDADVTDTRGFDHGTWTPLALAYPDADIPTAQLSVQPDRPPLFHFKLGQALAPLRQQGILILGSGALTHNLPAAFRHDHDTPPPWVMDFVDWVHDALVQGRVEDLVNYMETAPHGAQNHPTPEHFLPLFVALGAASPDATALRMHHSMDYGVLAMDMYQFT
ncbi:class III extradiol ring-cleavage dioxygenase [Magnetovibrio sp.]|uniref:DODA-type extradiol aromatic ring-opening family dioxygenase n=1 Tax=Magnetovibrio sp. TaxID=2024836 RepID=UPI002F94EC7C